MEERANVEYFINSSSTKINPIKPYTINFHHLVIILEGSCTYVVNGEKIVLKENDALLLCPGTHRERLHTPEYLHLVIFNYQLNNNCASMSNQLFKNAVNMTIRKLLDVYPYKTYRQIANSVNNTPDNPKLHLVVQNIFECILYELFETLDYQTKCPHIITALKFINDNITYPITLNDVSKTLHLSKEYTSRLFKQEMDMTVSEYINKQKLSLAKDMLTNKNVTLQEISGVLGYENYSYFTKIFKETYKISPQKMRSELMKTHE